MALEHVPIVVAQIDGKTPRYLHPHLVSMEHEEHDGKTRVTLTFAMRDTEDASEALAIERGSKIKLRWGYVGNLSEPTTISVIGVKPDYKAGTFKVTARDRSHALGGDGVKFRTFQNRTVQQIAKQIAESRGMKIVFPQPPPPAPKKGTRSGHGKKQVHSSSTAGAAQVKAALQAVYNDVQRGKTDLEILHTLAARAGCELQVETRAADGASFVFAPRPHHDPPARVVWWRHAGGTLLDLDVEERAPKGGGKAGHGAKAVTVDPLEQKVLEAFRGARERKGRPVLGSAAPLGGVLADGVRRAGDFFLTSSRHAGVAVSAEAAALDRAERVVRSPAARDLVDSLSPSIRPTFGKLQQVIGAFFPEPSSGAPGDKDKAAQKAAAAHQAGEQEAVKAKAVLVGDPSLRRRQIIDVRGGRPRDTGKWMVIGVKHKVGSGGYVTELELRRHGQQKRTRHEAKTSGRTNNQATATKAQPKGPTWIVQRGTTGIPIAGEPNSMRVVGVRR